MATNDTKKEMPTKTLDRSSTCDESSSLQPRKNAQVIFRSESSPTKAKNVMQLRIAVDRSAMSEENKTGGQIIKTCNLDLLEEPKDLVFHLTNGNKNSTKKTIPAMKQASKDSVVFPISDPKCRLTITEEGKEIARIDLSECFPMNFFGPENEGVEDLKDSKKIIDDKKLSGSKNKEVETVQDGQEILENKNKKVGYKNSQATKPDMQKAKNQLVQWREDEKVDVPKCHCLFEKFPGENAKLFHDKSSGKTPKEHHWDPNEKKERKT